MRGAESAPSHPIRPERIATRVADEMRRRILESHDELLDGEYLPKEDELRAEFGIGRPAMREAMRILEAEGLITVLRGNRGGAIVRAPRTENLAYTLGLVLAARKIRVGDVGVALRELEPACAVFCAEREDRELAVVRPLVDLHERAVAAAAKDDLETVTSLFRSFHEQLVAGCGNDTMIAVVGGLERLWSSHVRANSARATRRGRPRPASEIDRSLADHDRILRRIRAGDANGVRAAVGEHIHRVQAQPRPFGSNTAIDLTTLRTSLQD